MQITATSLAHVAELCTIVARLPTDEGVHTIDVASGRDRTGEAAFTISPLPDRSTVLDRPPAIAELVSFILRNDDLLSREPYVLRATRVGCSYHLDVSVLHEDLNTAVHSGRDR